MNIQLNNEDRRKPSTYNNITANYNNNSYHTHFNYHICWQFANYLV